MSARIVPLAELSAADIGRWRELATVAVEPNPFFEPEMLLPAAEFIAKEEIALLIAERDGAWDALIPVTRVRRWHRVPAPGLAGWRHRYCFLGTPLARQEGLENSIADLVDGGLRGAMTSFFGLDTAAADGPVMAALAALTDRGRISATELRHSQRATLRRRDDGAYVQVKPKHRREHRRQRDRLSEQLGSPLETADEAGSEASVAEFMRIEASGWKGRAGTAFADLEPDRRFFAAICEAFADLGRLQLLALRSGERAVAMKCNIRAGDGLFCFKIAFDEAWTRYSPGILLELDNVERFHADEALMWMDSCADPDNEMINRLWPDRRELTTVALGKGLMGTLSRGTFRAARRARDTWKGS